MTKKTFMRWKLKILPTPSDIATLIDKGVITKEEARQILFSPEETDERSVDSLKEEIKFLRDLVEKLSNQNHSRIVEIIREIKKPYYRWPWWSPYDHWCTTYLTTGNDTNLTASGTISLSSTSNFSDIQTF